MRRTPKIPNTLEELYGKNFAKLVSGIDGKKYVFEMSDDADMRIHLEGRSDWLFRFKYPCGSAEGSAAGATYIQIFYGDDSSKVFGMTLPVSVQDFLPVCDEASEFLEKARVADKAKRPSKENQPEWTWT